MKTFRGKKGVAILGIFALLILGAASYLIVISCASVEPGGNCEDVRDYIYEGQPYRGDATVILGPAYPLGEPGEWLWIMGAGTRVGGSGMVASTLGEFRPWKPWDPVEAGAEFDSLRPPHFRGACLEDIITITNGTPSVPNYQDLLAVSRLVYGESYEAPEGVDVPEFLEGLPFYTMEALLMQLRER